MSDLSDRIEQIIEKENKNNPDIQYLNKSHTKLITQIISNYNLLKSNSDFPEAKMIFLGAPTGSGKDILVRKIMAEDKSQNYVILNMDIFRYYHNELAKTDEYISDRDFAQKTNQTSYEIYYIIQKIILEEFPGTNIIVTGTIRDLNWVKDIINTFKNDKKTNYSISLVSLAVPVTESALSIFERYLNLVDSRDSSNSPIRYTGLTYHNDTVKEFISNIDFFDTNLKNNDGEKIIDSIKVYRRNIDILDDSENNLIYDSNFDNNNNTAAETLRRIMNSNPEINKNRLSKLLDIVNRNKEYLEKQELYDSIVNNLNSIMIKNYVQD